MSDNKWFLLVIHLDKVDDMSAIVEIVNNNGVTGCTILESTGVGHTTFTSFTNPIIASMSRLIGPDKQYNKTIHTVVEGLETLGTVMDQIEELVGDFCTPDRGIMYSIPLREVRGYRVVGAEGVEECKI